MRTILLGILFLSSSFSLFAQDGDFSFGQIPKEDFFMTKYDKDSAANAVVLKEFGNTYIDNSQDNFLIFNYHVRIKVLNDQGVNHANFVIPIHKLPGSTREEVVYNVKGSAFNMDNGSVTETDFKQKNIFTQNKDRYTDIVKFTIPNVRSGSVIEVSYTLSSPFVYNFRGWDFQSDIPKMYSEYWARIPANFDYNISLVGYLKLTENNRSVIKDCLTSFDGGKADCTLMKLGMKDIPAFREEKYMTSPKNFISAVHFELSAIHRFDGSSRQVAKTWSDVDQSLAQDKDFGLQLKRGKSFFRKALDTLYSGEGDELSKAKRIYSFIQNHYRWDEYNGILCEIGIKEAFETRKGNIGDINLSLVAALRAAGLNADPVLISTRDNGLPPDIFPVISDFNYVLVRLKTAQQTYLLDAAHRSLPFGVFPMSCINGNGRVIYQNKPSGWMPVAAPVNLGQVNIAEISLDDSGHIEGTITRTYNGYLALAKRQEIHSYNSMQDYFTAIKSKWNDITILHDSVSNLDQPDTSLVETMEITLNASPGSSVDKIIFNPFFESYVTENPFKSVTRSFPVDFGAPERLSSVLIFKFPKEYQVISSPADHVMELPAGGGKYLLGAKTMGNKLVLNTLLEQTQPVYQPDEYPVLREFYNRIVQAQRAMIVLAKH
ncbi:MAG: DUF3857 domain-containing protein [Chitinophagaceae bacterium]|nr:MAG: DUF3857 domain-containing protein [Chitinophagaceae bacterium]